MSEYTAVQTIKWRPAEKRLVERAAQLEGYDSVSEFSRRALLKRAREVYQQWLENATQAEQQEELRLTRERTQDGQEVGDRA